METVGDLLALRRRAQFVGRGSEIALFVAALEADDPPWSVLFVHGPGGIGKTSLLDAFAVRATDTGTPVVRIDLRDVPLTEAERHRIVAAVRDARQAASSRTVALLLDSYEAIDAGDEALRAELLPALPTAALTVIAGRVPPGPAWRADQAWRDMVRVISLRNLGPDDSRALLRRCGVDPALHARMVAVSHGHPMALTLLADVVARGGMAVDDPLTPDLVHTLVRRFVEAVPSELYRRALEASALARVTTEPLLRDALEIDDAHDVFMWLRELSFMDAGPDGIYPHDLAATCSTVTSRSATPRRTRAPCPRPHPPPPPVGARSPAATGVVRREVRLPQPARDPVAGRLGQTRGSATIPSRLPRGTGRRSSSSSGPRRATRRRRSPAGGSSGSPMPFT